MSSNGRGINLSQPLDERTRARLLARLEAQSEKTETCWVWTGYRRNGHHGALSVHNRPTYVHELSYAIHFGPIPEGTIVRHHCDNPPYWRPQHLAVGTQADNIADMWARGRARPGVTRGMAHHLARLTNDQVGEIRRRWAAGRVRQRDLAVEYGCTQSTIWRFVHGITRVVQA